jgi:hypothetical protein
MFLLPSRSVSPNAYCAPSVENKMRASANVIHPRSSGGNADKERASVAPVDPSSFMASDGAAVSAPNSYLMRLAIPILEASCCLGAASGQHYRGAAQLIARLFVRFFHAFSNAIGKRETPHSLYSHGI